MTRITHIAYGGLGGPANVVLNLIAADPTKDFTDHIIFFGVEPLLPGYTQKCQEQAISYADIRKTGKVGVRSFLDLKKSLHAAEPDIIMVNGTSFLPQLLLIKQSGRLRKSKLVVRECQANHLKTRAEWLGSYLALRHADAVVFLTEEHKSTVLQRYPRAAAQCRAIVIPNGVKSVCGARYEPAPAAPLRLCMASRFTPTKGQQELVEASAILLQELGGSGLVLTLAGDGVTRDSVENQVVACGLSEKVYFTGTLAEDSLIELFLNTDIYLHITDGETMSNAILLAMASRLPVIASDVAGVNNMISNNVNGVLSPRNDPQALATKIQWLAKDLVARQRLTAQAYADFNARWSAEKMAQEYRALFKSLL